MQTGGRLLRLGQSLNRKVEVGRLRVDLSRLPLLHNTEDMANLQTSIMRRMHRLIKFGILSKECKR
jgi:hypothetical protein